VVIWPDCRIVRLVPVARLPTDQSDPTAFFLSIFLEPAVSHLSGLGTLARTYRLVIFAIVGLVTVIAGVGLTKIKFDRDPRVYFGEETADRLLFDNFEESYGRITSAVAVLKDKDDADLDVDALKALRELSKRFDKVEGVAKTTSIVSLPILTTTGSDGKPRPVALTDIEDPSDEDVEKLLQEIRKDPSRFNSLVSEDLSTALVSVTMQLPGTEKDKFNTAVDEIKDIKDEVAETFDDKEILLTGDGLLPSNFDAAFNIFDGLHVQADRRANLFTDREDALHHCFVVFG